MSRLPFRTAWGVAAAASVLILLHSACGTDTTRYDPELYREHIEKIEELIYQQEAGPEDGAALTEMTTALAGAMGQNIENFRQRETIMNRLISFGETFASRELTGIPMDLQEARAGWEQIRTDFFEPADWFK